MSNDTNKKISQMEERHRQRLIANAANGLNEGDARRAAIEENNRRHEQILARHKMITAAMVELLRQAGGQVTIPIAALERVENPEINFQVVDLPERALIVTLEHDGIAEEDDEPQIGELGIDTTKEDAQ